MNYLHNCSYSSMIELYGRFGASTACRHVCNKNVKKVTIETVGDRVSSLQALTVITSVCETPEGIILKYCGRLPDNKVFILSHRGCHEVSL